MSKMSHKFTSIPLDQVDLIADALIETLHPGCALCMHGDMGAGKTTLALHMLRKWGVNLLQGSPSYAIIQSYDAPNGRIYHIDAFRIENETEAFELGLQELFEEKAIFIVEWPEKIIKFLPETVFHLNIDSSDLAFRHYTLNHDN